MTKVELLRSLVKDYLQYIEKWTNVEVTCTNGKVKVRWYRFVTKNESDGTPRRYVHDTTREFPLADIDKRILSYRSKILRQREKEKI